MFNPHTLVVKRGSSLKLKLEYRGEDLTEGVDKLFDYDGFTFKDGLLTVKSDCELTNISYSNRLILDAAVEKYVIVSVYVVVVNDISEFGFTLNGQNVLTAGSNVAKESVTVNFTVTCGELSYRTSAEVSASGGDIDLNGILTKMNCAGKPFTVRIDEIYVCGSGGMALISGEESFSDNEYVFSVNIPELKSGE